MKLVKTSAIVLAVSAMLSGAAFAQQGQSTDSQTRGGLQRGTGSGMSGGADTEMNSQADAPGTKAGGKTGKGTVGAGRGSMSDETPGAATGGATGSGATGGKRY